MKVLFVNSDAQNNDELQIKERIFKYLKANYELIVTTVTKKRKELPENYEILFDTSGYDLALIEMNNLADAQVGFLAGFILSRGKPVIVLYPKDQNQPLIEDIKSPRLITSEYSLGDIESVIEWCIDEVKLNLASRRFTMFISPDLEMFLNNITTNLNTSKSEFIRQLILKEKENHTPLP